MSVFHQIGHDSKNLLNEENLSNFKGAVCSPLNYSQSDTVSLINTLPETFQSILDPQLYYPKSNRGKLHTWTHFPDDFDSADQTDLKWWKNLCNNLLDACLCIGCSHVCSPSSVPSKFTNDYYKFNIEIGNYLYTKAKSSGVDYYQTAIVDYNSIKEEAEAEIIASILSQAESDAIYLIVRADIEPRRELFDSDSITGIMKLIKLVTDAGMEVLVAYCSTEFLLWKYAGAKDFATGKYFNLRRFTSSRFDEPSGGGGQLPYWFERNLMAYLREGDLIRLNNEDMLHPDYMQNPFCIRILEQLETAPDDAWLSLSWRAYLNTFASLEASMSDKKEIRNLLIAAENNWTALEDDDILMEEVRNNGSWIRPWRIAISNFNKTFK